MTADTAEREAFEIEARRWGLPTNIPGATDGGYLHGGTALAWKFWQARAALPARAPEGWVLVPREPTPEMDRVSAMKIDCKCGRRITQWGVNTWPAMLSASPPPPEQGEGIGLAEPLASPAPGPAEPVVRALEWLSPVKPFYAVTPFCQYCIDSVNDDTGPHWQTTISYQGSMYRRHDTEEEAKAAAQADYERRIISALTQPAPAQVAGGEANRRPDVGEPGWREAEAGRQGAEARADALAARVAELEATLRAFEMHYPMGINCWLDDAARTARRLLQPKAPAPAGEGGGS